MGVIMIKWFLLNLKFAIDMETYPWWHSFLWSGVVWCGLEGWRGGVCHQLELSSAQHQGLHTTEWSPPTLSHQSPLDHLISRAIASLSLNWIQIKRCLEIHDISLLFLSFVTTDIPSKIIQSLSRWQCNRKIKTKQFNREADFYIVLLQLCH